MFNFWDRKFKFLVLYPLVALGISGFHGAWGTEEASDEAEVQSPLHDGFYEHNWFSNASAESVDAEGINPYEFCFDNCWYLAPASLLIVCCCCKPH